ncbi:LytTR family DNA-binding domain-containing protein [Maricaulis sp.]|uniref:LytR/AlgR family response regulator transcription factor n=1 Tax=Maricaulis sp. TaxID=1486257 RepID=UPI0025C18372|nr:LytTR family DNA-binding domain-containing protein [Maricaulis sp.]
MSRINVLIVEDEPVVARRVERHCRAALGEAAGRIERVDGVEAAVGQLQTGAFGLVMLDLNLHGEDGFDVLDRMTSHSAHTIIVSAYADQAARAFDHGVLDFVTKPFEAERIALAIERYRGKAAARPEKARYLSFRSGRRVERVSLDEVILVRGADKYAEVVLGDGRVKLHDKSIGKIAPLMPDSFMRVHKSWIVRLDCVEGLESFPGNRHALVLKTGERAPVSRSLISQVRALFQ